tara:strand:+ start:269 stop:703 length:435 start_codon:yes stop_codon:yes gene_type:complete
MNGLLTKEQINNMNTFFATKEVREERLAICNECPLLYKPTMTCRRCMCFMNIKSSISAMSCPEKKWLATNKSLDAGVIPKDLEMKALEIWELIKDKKAPNHKVKKEMIELYNTIYNANYQTNTNCSSCLQACYNGIKRIKESFD